MKLINTRKGGKPLLRYLNKFIVTLLVLCSFTGAFAQVVEPDSLSFESGDSLAEYPFINFEADTILNGAHLYPFLTKLINLENGDSTRVSILHIGDSHIQADFITRVVRKNFQLRFGNAGRGLVFPLRVAGTNEPADYRSSSNGEWTTTKINSQVKYIEPGISGISMMSDTPGTSFDIRTFNHDDLDYSFNEVTLIHSKDSIQYDCRFTDDAAKFGYLMSAQPMEGEMYTTSVQFGHATNYVQIQAEQTEISQKSTIVNGVVLKNNCPGVLYHSVGINGAHYADYNSSPLFFKQIQLLKPDLVILSLGTNEGANIKISEAEMMNSVISMVQKVKSAVPGVNILITTPADDYFRKKYKNPYLETVQRALIKSAENEKVACWDLYSISGGYGSCVEWRKAAMLQRDGVHFNKQGYTLQGLLLYNALIDSFTRYAAY